MKAALLIFALLLVSLTTLRACSLAQEPTVAVAASTLHEQVVARAAVVATHGVVEVRPLLGGTVRSVNVAVGARVLAGATLAELDAPGVQGEVERANAELEAFRLTAPTGEATNAARAARWRERALEAAVRTARERQALLLLRAPSEGTVLVRRINPGDAVTPESAAAAFEIADLSQLELRAEVEGLEGQQLATGLRATVTVPGGGPSLGETQIDRLAPSVERRALGWDDLRVRAAASTRSFWLALPASMRSYPLHSSLEVIVHLPERRVATALPRTAIQLRQGRAYALQAWGPFVQRASLRLGAADPTLVEVQGIAAGTPVFRSVSSP